MRSCTDSFQLLLARLSKYLLVAAEVGRQATIVVVEVMAAEEAVVAGILMAIIAEGVVEVALLFDAVVKMSLRRGPAEVGPVVTRMPVRHFARRSTVPFQVVLPHGQASREPVVPKT